MNENNESNTVSLEELRNSYLENAGETGAESESSGQQAGAENTAETQAALAQNDANTAAETPPDAEAGQPGYEERFGSAMDVSAQNDRLNELTAENAALKEQLARVSTEAGANAENANAEVAKALSGDDGLPQFDDESYSFASESERREIMSTYTKALVEYAVKKAQSDVLNRVAPLIDEYDRTVENTEFDNALKTLETSPEFDGIASYSDDIRRIGAREEFKGMKPYQRVALAALVAKGMRTSPAAVQKDIGTQAEDILNNEALMKELEMRKARKIDAARGDYPAQSASGGLSSAAYQVPRKAQSIEELRGMYSGM